MDMVYDQIIRGKTVDFRAVEEKDAEVTLKMRMDPHLNKYLHKVENSIENQIAFIRRQRQTPGDYLFIAEDKNGNPVGMRGIVNYDAEKKSCMTGRLIGQENAVQNTEIALFGYDFSFGILGVEKITLMVLEKNVNVFSAHKRFGAIEIGREYLEEFDDYNIIEILTKENYLKRRPKIYKLIEQLG